MSPSLMSEQLDEEPPQPRPHQMSAEELQNHPVWVNSRCPSPMVGPGPQGLGFGMRIGGRPGPGSVSSDRPKKKRGRDEPSEPSERPRYERISMMSLELQAEQEMDGADSHLNSDDSDGEESGLKRVPAKKSRGPRNEGEEEEDEEVSDDEDAPPRNRSAPSSGSAEQMMAAAAFGGGARAAFGQSDDGHSETSSKRRKAAYKEAFPVRGVHCVGCAIATRIAPVERFIKENIGRMTEEALWKMGALCYKRDVAEPCEREGVVVPGWSWKEIKQHYTYHSTNSVIGRHSMIRQLQMMRSQAETRLVRVDNGEREMDRQSAELMLKVRAHTTTPARTKLHSHPMSTGRTDTRGGVARAPAARKQGQGHRWLLCCHAPRRTRRVTNLAVTPKLPHNVHLGTRYQ